MAHPPTPPMPPDPDAERHKRKHTLPPWLGKAKDTGQKAYAKARDKLGRQGTKTAQAVASAIASTPAALATLAVAVAGAVGAYVAVGELNDLDARVDAAQPVNVDQLGRQVAELTDQLRPLRSTVDGLEQRIDHLPSGDGWAGVAREVDAASEKLTGLSARLDQVTQTTGDASRTSDAAAARVQQVARDVEQLGAGVQATAEELSAVAQDVADATGKATDALEAAAQAATAAASAQQVAREAQEAVAGLADQVGVLGDRVGSLEAASAVSVHTATGAGGEGVVEWPAGTFAAPPVVSVTPSTQDSGVHLCNVTEASEQAIRFRCWELTPVVGNRHLVAEPVAGLDVHVIAARNQ